MQIQPFEVFDDNPRYREIAEPFVIGWDDEPGSMLRTTAGQGILVSGYIIVPEMSLLVIDFADLPLLSGIVEPLLEATPLLFFGSPLSHPFPWHHKHARINSRKTATLCQVIGP